MKITMTAQLSGTRNGLDWPAPGTEIDLPEREAQDLIAAKNAVASVDYANEGLTDAHLGGAPSARDITIGQPDTNLARAKVVAQVGEAAAREAAKRVGLDASPNDDAPKVGDVEFAEGFGPDTDDVENAAVSNAPRKPRK